MVYRRLGQTGLYPSLLSFGSHTDKAYRISSSSGNRLNDEGQRRRDRHLLHGLDLGINLFDVYEDEGQWEPVKRVLGPYRSKVLLSVSRNFKEYIGDAIDRAARLFGYSDLFRLHTNDFEKVGCGMVADWDAMRKAKEAGKVRAIGLSIHNETVMMDALDQLDGIDFILFPYNFIHARADFSRFIPAATAKGIGLIAMKPLALGSIVNLDPRARSGPRPESENWLSYGSRSMSMPPAVVAEMTRTLNRLPDETLCQAAIRFVFSRKFLTCTIAGMWDDQWIDDNYAALGRYQEMTGEEKAALDRAAKLAKLVPGWLPRSHQWLEEKWRA
jgi:aryl-alcohol dehydrogenase-like predicted oxidoreductase